MSGKVANNPYRASGVVAALAEGRTGTVDWCSSIQTTGFTATTATGYFVNTTCAAITVTLPASPSVGDIVSVADYASTFATNNVTLGRGGSKINGACTCAILSTKGQSITMVYADATRGWKNTMDSTSDVTGATNYNVQYLVLAGGGGGGANYGAGGGAGGMRLVASKSFQVAEGTGYPITVGGGGAGSVPGGCYGTSGSNSIFSSITSAGGGGGGHSQLAGRAGGSGGGGGGCPGCVGAGGAGNTPPISSPLGGPQGSDGGAGTGPGGGGGGGHSEAGQAASGGGRGGAGTASAIVSAPSSVSYAGGAGGYPGGPASPCGTGAPSGGNGTTNKGGGGGGQSPVGPGVGAGGSGKVVIRLVTSCGPASGGGTETTCGSCTVHVFNGDGTFTA